MSSSHSIVGDIFGRKFCNGCQAHKTTDGGMYRINKTVKRWLCHTCVSRANESKYSKQKESE
jgi:hypothetical protein